MKNQSRTIAALLLFLAILLLAGLILADAGPVLPRSLISGGGGLVAGDGLELQSALGQPAAGTVNGNVTLCSGFFCDAGVSPLDGEKTLFLPIVVRGE